jgi:hypothetical protein
MLSLLLLEICPCLHQLPDLLNVLQDHFKVGGNPGDSACLDGDATFRLHPKLLTSLVKIGLGQPDLFIQAAQLGFTECSRPISREMPGIEIELGLLLIPATMESAP